MARAAASRSAPAAAPARRAAAPTFSIGELAREFGLTTRAIRFYEDCGLLAPQRARQEPRLHARATGRA